MTNWEKFKETITPEIFGDLVDTENIETGGCTHSPKGCREICKAQPEKSCKDLFLAWANREAVIEPVEPKGETCPKCGADTVIITRVEIQRCSKCGCPVGETR